MPERESRILTGALLPARLSDLPRPPVRVHLLGELPRGPGVAIVGTRTPSFEAEHFAAKLARALSRQGLVILSGGAEGIDAAAHRGALRARGPTVVVAPAGFERPFPAKNAALFRRIVARGGAYLSLRAPAEVAQRSSFFPRNACLAALAHAVIVVETRFRGGARNAAAWARRLGRPLLVVPSAPWIKSGSGCLLELRRGATLCAGPRDVLRELERTLVALPGASARRTPPAARPTQASLPFGEPPALASDVLKVLRAVQAGARHLDAVCEALGMPPAVAQSHLLTLTLEGVLVADPAGHLEPKPANRPVSLSKYR